MIQHIIASLHRVAAGRWPQSLTRSQKRPPARWRDIEAGQATTEYALILLVAAVIATLVITWATVGGGSGRIGELFDTILDGILQRADTGAQ